MRPRYFKFLAWDYRPYGVPQDLAKENPKVIYEKNDSLWFDIISSAKKGFFLSSHAAAALLGEGLIARDEATRCYSEKPIPKEKDNPFPDYWLVQLREKLHVRTMQYNWQGYDESTERTITEGALAPHHLGVAEDINTGSPVGLICDARLLCIARKLRLTNFWFKPLDLPDHPSVLRPPFKVDYQGEQWPPQWYPSDFEPHAANLTDEILPDQVS